MKDIPYKCGSCFHWREMGEQSKDASGKVGVCHGAPPAMLVVPVRLNQTPAGIVVANDEKQRSQQGVAMSQNQPMMLENDNGCAHHQDSCVQQVIYTRQKVMEWEFQQQLMNAPPAGNA